jgi:predicted anti-sigma-YlaC factor YlaD
MKSCDEVRTALACGEEETLITNHLQECDGCRCYVQRINEFENQIASLVVVAPPAELTSRLLAIAADHAMPPVRSRQPWWSTLMAFLIGVTAVVTSVLILAELVVLFAGPFGFGAYASDIVQLPMALYAWMRKVVPTVADALTTIEMVRTQLVVILMVTLMFFGWYGQRSVKQRKQDR